MKRSRLVFLLTGCVIFFSVPLLAQDIKQPDAAGSFYPANPQELSAAIDLFLKKVNPQKVEGEVFGLILPHAGYAYSAEVAAYGYKLVRGREYRTVVIIASSHSSAFRGISVYGKGSFLTPLGAVDVDADFAAKVLNKDSNIFFEPEYFKKEHPIEVQIPFLQMTLRPGWKLLPIVMGQTTMPDCQRLAGLLKDAIGSRRDILVIASTDMYHGYDFEEGKITDGRTLAYLKNMDTVGLYKGLEEGTLQLCGGQAVVTMFLLAKELGHNKAVFLNQNNSADVTGNRTKGVWTVGYSSFAIDKPGDSLLNNTQHRKLLKLARDSIAYYLKNGKKLPIEEGDPKLNEKVGAFVTLHERGSGRLRGCIGNLTGAQPLYLTIRDMAVEAAVSDPRFLPVKPAELKNIEIEISVLSALKRVFSADDIQLGKHGVVVKRGFNQGLFLPQVAAETGMSKEEFLSELCSQKAGLDPDAWKDPATELYIFTAEVFSEKNC